MKRKYFFVIYLHDETIRSILDLMRIVADNRQRNFAHITVKGPYQNRLQKKLDDDNETIKGKEIKVLGVGNFFSDNQNTVFFKCEDRKELYSIWKTKEEKTYKDFHPHITIYDGDNKQFANELFDTINSHNIHFSFIVDKLELYSSADKDKLFNLREVQENYRLLTEIADIKIAPYNIDKLTSKQRIQIIDRLCDILEKINHHHDNDTHSPNILNGSLLMDI
jgi:2'-5' RNA ligase